MIAAACGDTAHRPVPSGAPLPAVAPTPARPAQAAPTARGGESLGSLEAAGRSPIEMTASAVEGHPPLPTYRATVRNVSDRPVRRVVATVVYLDANGRPMPGESHDVAFGSPLKPIEPGVRLETSFLSRVDGAPGVRLVTRVVTFLEPGPERTPVPRDWKNPRYEADLAETGRR